MFVLLSMMFGFFLNKHSLIKNAVKRVINYCCFFLLPLLLLTTLYQQQQLVSSSSSSSSRSSIISHEWRLDVGRMLMLRLEQSRHAQIGLRSSHLSSFVGQDLNEQFGKTSRNYTERIRHVRFGKKTELKKLFLSCYKVTAPDLTMTMNKVSQQEPLTC